MNSVQIVIPDLLLPRELMQLATTELALPSLQQLLARENKGQATISPVKIA